MYILPFAMSVFQKDEKRLNSTGNSRSSSVLGQKISRPVGQAVFRFYFFRFQIVAKLKEKCSP